ncbi:MAG: hypothetical protein R2715_01285 [Ilumatobacteraceae bacterium]
MRCTCSTTSISRSAKGSSVLEAQSQSGWIEDRCDLAGELCDAFATACSCIQHRLAADLQRNPGNARRWAEQIEHEAHHEVGRTSEGRFDVETIVHGSSMAS